MELFLESLHILSVAIGAAGVLVILVGVAKGLFALAAMELNASSGEVANRRTELRHNLGFYLLLGLEFLVAADIIETLSAPTLEHLAILGGIVLIRTVISFSLNWELAHHAAKTSA